MVAVDARVLQTPAVAPRRRRVASRSVWIGVLAAAGVVVVLALPLWLPSPDAQVIAQRLRPPSLAHPFGTDEFGRDVLTRVVYGARISWLVSAAATTCALIVGGLYGAASALIGRWVDTVLMRVLEVILAFPGPLLALVFAIAIGPGLRTVIIAIAIVYSAPVARLVRGLVRDELKQDYVAAAVIIGSSRRRIMLRHIVINISAPVVVYGMAVAAEAILVEAALSYLGAGVAPPTPSWGSMVQEGQNLVFGGVWWVTVFAGAAIALTVFVINTLADSIVDELRIGGRRG